MPELPEVETIRRDLERAIAGRTITAVDCTGLRCIRRHASPEEFADRLVGRTVTAVRRRGKYLLVRLDGAGLDGVHLIIHLGMSGQLLWSAAAAAADPKPKHTHVVLRFDGADGELRYVDPRTFGELFVTTADAAAADTADTAPAELAHLGPDPLGDVTPARLAEMLQARRTRIKALLMDQKFVAGIGNIYADEILWAAGIRHDRTSDSLTADDVQRLHKAMLGTLRAAIEHRGSSLSDEQYRDLFGRVGDFQSRHNVYDREGKPCNRCDAAITRVKWQGRSTFFCGRCQA